MNRRNMKKVLVKLLLVFGTIPVWWAIWFMLNGSLMPVDELNTTVGPVLSGREGMASWPFITSWPTLVPLTELLFDTPQFFVMFWNSFFIVIPSVLGQLIIGAPAAWAISRLRFCGNRALFTTYVVMMLMPFQVTMVPNYLVASSLGLLDTIGAVVFPFIFSAFPVFIMVKSFDAVPRALLEAAAIDGAGHFVTFFKIGLPLGVPGILSAFLLGFIECWNAIEQPMILIRDKSLWPLSLYLPSITEEKLGIAMIASVVILIPPVLLFLSGQKYLELGIQATGIKE